MLKHARLDERIDSFSVWPELTAGPAEGDDFLGMGALRDVAAADVAEHEGQIPLGVELENELHALAALRAGWVLGTLNPMGANAEGIEGWRKTKTPPGVPGGVFEKSGGTYFRAGGHYHRPERLNDCVRNGDRCIPFSMFTRRRPPRGKARRP